MHLSYLHVMKAFVWISPLVTDTVIFSLTIYRTKHYLHHLISPYVIIIKISGCFPLTWFPLRSPKLHEWISCQGVNDSRPRRDHVLLFHFPGKFDEYVDIFRMWLRFWYSPLFLMVTVFCLVCPDWRQRNSCFLQPVAHQYHALTTCTQLTFVIYSEGYDHYGQCWSCLS